MAVRITRECISCGTCFGRCPNDAVYVNAEDEFAIDPERCTECIDQPKRRCENICCIGAIELDPEHRETPQQRWEKHRRLHAVALEDVLSF